MIHSGWKQYFGVSEIDERAPSFQVSIFIIVPPKIARKCMIPHAVIAWGLTHKKTSKQYVVRASNLKVRQDKMVNHHNLFGQSEWLYWWIGSEQ